MDENKNEIIVEDKDSKVVMDGNAPKKGGFNTKLFIIILICVTVVIVTCACVIRAARFGSRIGGKIGSFIKPILSNEISIADIFDEDNYESDSSENITYPVENFEKIDADLNLSNVEITNGTEYSVIYKGNAGLAPDVKMTDNCLVITQKNSNFNFTAFTPRVTSNVVITVPENVTLENISIKEDLGNVKIRDIKADKMQLMTDLGNVTINNIDVADDTEITTSLGNIIINDSKFEDMDMQVDLGNITVKSDFKNIDATSDQGNINIQGSGESIEATSDLGNITVDTVGNAEIKMDLETDLGNIHVNGEKVTGRYRN